MACLVLTATKRSVRLVSVVTPPTVVLSLETEQGPWKGGSDATSAPCPPL